MGPAELWIFRSQDHSLPGAKVPGVELSLPGTFAPLTFRSLTQCMCAEWNQQPEHMVTNVENFMLSKKNLQTFKICSISVKLVH